MMFVFVDASGGTTRRRVYAPLPTVVVGVDRPLKVATTQFKRARTEGVQKWFEEYASKLEGRIREGD